MVFLCLRLEDAVCLGVMFDPHTPTTTVASYLLGGFQRVGTRHRVVSVADHPGEHGRVTGHVHQVPDPL